MPRVYGPLSLAQKEALRRANKGNKYRLGIPHTDKIKKQISNSLKGNTHLLGKKFSDETKKKMSLARKGWNPSKETRRRMGEHQKGKGNRQWKGGITSLQRALRSSVEYRQWRSDVFTRDDFTCQECGMRGAYIHAHHIKSLSSMLRAYGIKTMEEARVYAELWNINNGQTLCEDCHKKTNSYASKAE